MAKYFKVQLCLKRLPSGDSVHFKVDGGRFDVERTVKLNVNTKYKVELTFKPVHNLESLNIQGGDTTFTESKKDSLCVVYTGEWLSSGLDVNKKGNRQQIPLLLKLEEIGLMKINLQCKFYAEDDKNHSNWGTPISYIEYECEQPENATYVDIKKESYR